MRHKRYWIIGAIGAGVVVWASQSLGSQAPEARPVAMRPAPRAAAAPAPVPAAAPPAQLASRDGARPFDCLIEPSQVVKLSAPVEGVLERIEADRGQFVQRGEVVARLQSDVETIGLQIARTRAENVYTVGSAKSRLQYLAAKRNRADSLRKHLSKDIVEEAEAEANVAVNAAGEAENALRVARLEFNQAARLLQQRVVRSPIDGVVTERMMSPGEFRSNYSAHILTIARLNPLHVEVFAPISQINDVHIGDRAIVFPEDPIGGRYPATVKIIDKVFDAASGTFGLRLELPNPGNRLPAGLRCRIQFDA